MTGLEKMKSQILNEANETADAKIEAAKAEAESILAEAKAEAEKSKISISQKSEAAIANYKERVISANDLQSRTKILAAKQEVIADILDQAHVSLKTMKKEDYFEMLLKILEKYVQPLDGEIFFSPADLKELPAGYEEKIIACANAKGGNLRVSEEGRDIENGFVLAYGGIEENCILQAMFEAKKDELSDKVHQILFL